MGHKISPTSLRLNITESWRSRWISRGKDQRNILKQDHEIREFIYKAYKKAGILRIDIERFSDQLHIIIRTARPGVLIGRAGAGVEEIRKKIQKMAKLKAAPRITIPTEDVRSSTASAQALAINIAEQMEKRIPYRRLAKQAVDSMMQNNVRGVKITVSGRLDGAEIARTETFQKGKLPLHTLRADIDFARSTAFTTYGTVGVKVWIYQGDVLQFGEATKASAERQPQVQHQPRPNRPQGGSANSSPRSNRPAKTAEKKA